MTYGYERSKRCLVQELTIDDDQRSNGSEADFCGNLIKAQQIQTIKSIFLIENKKEKVINLSYPVRKTIEVMTISSAEYLRPFISHDHIWGMIQESSFCYYKVDVIQLIAET